MAKKLEIITNSTLIKKIKDIVVTNGTLFGSRKWGCSQPNSDYDYLIENEFLDDIIIAVDEHFGTYKEYFELVLYPEAKLYNYRSIKFNVDGAIINLIGYDRTHYLKDVIKANKRMTRFSKGEFGYLLKNKLIRHRIFEEIIGTIILPF